MATWNRSNIHSRVLYCVVPRHKSSQPNFVTPKTEFENDEFSYDIIVRSFIIYLPKKWIFSIIQIHRTWDWLKRQSWPSFHSYFHCFSSILKFKKKQNWEKYILKKNIASNKKELKNCEATAIYCTLIHVHPLSKVSTLLIIFCCNF